MKKFLLSLLLVLALVLPSSAARAQSGNEMLPYFVVQQLINNGTFIQTNPGCNFVGNQATSFGTFTACIKNNGACGGASNMLMSYGAMLACRVLTTTITPVVYWDPANPPFTHATGASFLSACCGAGPPGAPNPSNKMTLGWSTFMISGGQVLSGTTMNASAWINAQGGIPGCLYIATQVNAGIVAGGCFAPGGWAQFNVAYTAPTTGFYYVLVSSAPQTGFTQITGIGVSN